MRLSSTTSVLALCATAGALSDSSPFVMVSTAQFDQPSNADQIQTSSQVLASVKDILKSCPTKRYLLASQPNAHASDIRGCANSPFLCRAISGSAVKGSFSVAEVVGAWDTDQLADHIKTSCAAKGETAEVVQSKLAPLPRYQGRAEALGDNDFVLSESLDKLHSSDSYTFIYLSSPTEPTYEAEFAEPLHAELKRAARSAPVRRASNDTDFNKLRLFEKYQFFTPGIFMGIIVVIVLLSILGVGLRALASLEVSYGAFDKDMGPSAQKKQM